MFINNIVKAVHICLFADDTSLYIVVFFPDCRANDKLGPRKAGSVGSTVVC